MGRDREYSTFNDLVHQEIIEHSISVSSKDMDESLISSSYSSSTSQLITE
jgi:hypothetical protein